MSEEILKARFGISPLIDLEIDVAGLGTVGLAADATHDTRVNVTAAVIALQMGYSSIDYVKKRYVIDTKEHEPRDNLLRWLVHSHLRTYDTFYAAFGDGRDEAPIGVFAFDLAMVRANESLKLLLHIARQGFLLEPALLARSLVEQFAYAAFVWDKTDDADIFGTQPQSLIKHLALIYPSAGRAYGILSKLAHYDPNQHHEFIGFQDASVVQRSWKFKIQSLAWVFLMLDMKKRLFEKFYAGCENFEILVNGLEDDLLQNFDDFFDGVSSPGIHKVRALFLQ